MHWNSFITFYAVMFFSDYPQAGGAGLKIGLGYLLVPAITAHASSQGPEFLQVNGNEAIRQFRQSSLRRCHCERQHNLSQECLRDLLLHGTAMQVIMSTFRACTTATRRPHKALSAWVASPLLRPAGRRTTSPVILAMLPSVRSCEISSFMRRERHHHRHQQDRAARVL